MDRSELLALTADIVAAHVENNSTSVADLPRAITSVYDALASLSQPAVVPEERQEPAVAIRSSVKPDSLSCLECGATQKTLKRHLGNAHDLTPAAYREKWNLPASYPMVAPNYAAQRSEMAKRIGLGRKPTVAPLTKKAVGRPRKKLGVVPV